MNHPMLKHLYIIYFNLNLLYGMVNSQYIRYMLTLYYVFGYQLLLFVVVILYLSLSVSCSRARLFLAVTSLVFRLLRSMCCVYFVCGFFSVLSRPPKCAITCNMNIYFNISIKINVIFLRCLLAILFLSFHYLILLVGSHRYRCGFCTHSQFIRLLAFIGLNRCVCERAR